MHGRFPDMTPQGDAERAEFVDDMCGRLMLGCLPNSIRRRSVLWRRSRPILCTSCGLHVKDSRARSDFDRCAHRRAGSGAPGLMCRGEGFSGAGVRPFTPLPLCDRQTHVPRIFRRLLSLLHRPLHLRAKSQFLNERLNNFVGAQHGQILDRRGETLNRILRRPQGLHHSPRPAHFFDDRPSQEGISHASSLRSRFWPSSPDRRGSGQRLNPRIARDSNRTLAPAESKPC